MPIDYTQLLKQISPPRLDGEDVVKLRVATVTTTYQNGTADITLSGVLVPAVPVLSGAAVYVGGSVQVLSYRGSLLIIGQVQTGIATSMDSANINNVTTTSTSYAAAASNNVGGFFRVPASGRVKIDFSGELYGSGANGQVMSLEIREGTTVGSGTVIVSPSDDYAVRSFDTARVQASNFYVFKTGTPGSAYNARLHYRTTGGTANFERRQMVALPIP